ncbi:MAG: hypothetical protein EOM62_21875, partial [Bacteroidia bacterium]|nr:hypothetical protein [Bacteroidia bacterium]
KSEGKTPENTVSAQIYADIQKKGDKSLFEKVAPGIFALKSTGKNETTITPIPEIPAKKQKYHPLNKRGSNGQEKVPEKVLKEFGGKTKPEGAGARACWFVGATYGGTDDQTPRFLQEGIWENGYQDKYLDAVKSIQVGDRIAIKSSYTRKHDLPFDSRGQTVSVMAIKAIGTVKENLGDGRTLKVDWKPFDPPREWYFYTNRSMVWRVLPGDWTTDTLIGFTFEEKAQDINRFRNAPYWRERFGDSSVDKRRFIWTSFYEAVADKLLTFRHKRDELIAGIHVIASKVDGLSNLQDQFADGSSGPLKDICPFTAMGIFNRGITDANRKAIASELASLLGVSEPVPDSFEGIPILN